MQNIQQDNESSFPLKGHCSGVMIGMVSVLMLLVLISGGRTVHAATAARPTLELNLAGPQTGHAGQALAGIRVNLINPGVAAENARLRLIIHDGADRDLKSGDIKIEVREGKSWRSVPLEPLDGGAMAAIGSEGSGHEERHQPGGFTIPANWNKLWQLRLTFQLPGVYKLVVAVSPDNGQTHLAPPATIILEAL